MLDSWAISTTQNGSVWWGMRGRMDGTLILVQKQGQGLPRTGLYLLTMTSLFCNCSVSQDLTTGMSNQQSLEDILSCIILYGGGKGLHMFYRVFSIIPYLYQINASTPCPLMEKSNSFSPHCQKVLQEACLTLAENTRSQVTLGSSINEVPGLATVSRNLLEAHFHMACLVHRIGISVYGIKEVMFSYAPWVMLIPARTRKVLLCGSHLPPASIVI